MSDRVITQNLLVSAGQADAGKSMTFSALQDLVALINVAVLHDRCWVLGRAAHDLTLAKQSELGRFLVDNRILRVATVPDDHAVRATTIARRYLASFLGDDLDDSFVHVLRYALKPTSAKYALIDVPDGRERMTLGRDWVKVAPRGRDLVSAIRHEHEVSRSATFMLRTFVYLGYASAVGLPLVADSARVGVIHDVLEEADRFVSDRVLQAISKNFKADHFRPSGVGLNVVSPFAAIVFQRCNGDRRRLVDEIKKLREDQTTTRNFLAGAEQAIDQAETHHEMLAAKRRWRQVIAEASRSFAIDPSLVSLEDGYSFAEEIPTNLDDFSNPAAWIGALRSLPGELLRRLLRRRPLAELHSLGKELPGPSGIRRDARALFGEIQLD